MTVFDMNHPLPKAACQPQDEDNQRVESSWRNTSNSMIPQWILPFAFGSNITGSSVWKQPSLQASVNECIVLDMDPHQLNQPPTFSNGPSANSTFQNSFFFNPSSHVNNFSTLVHSEDVTNKQHANFLLKENEDSVTLTDSPMSPLPGNIFILETDIHHKVAAEQRNRSPSSSIGTLVEQFSPSESPAVINSDIFASPHQRETSSERSSHKNGEKSREHSRNRSKEDSHELLSRRNRDKSPSIDYRSKDKSSYHSSKTDRYSDDYERRSRRHRSTTPSRRKRSRTPTKSRNHETKSRTRSSRRDRSPKSSSRRSRRSRSRSPHSRSKWREQLVEDLRGLTSDKEKDNGTSSTHKKGTKSSSSNKNQNGVEDALQAFALEIGDADLLRKKLKQKMLEKLKQSVNDDTSNPIDCPKPDETPDSGIRLYYDDNAKDNEDTEKEDSTHESEVEEVKTESETPSEACEEGVDEVYPWWRRAPMQHQIAEKFLKSEKIVFDSRPQKAVEENGFARTFPKRVKVQIKNPNIVSPSLSKGTKNGNMEIVKEVRQGFLVRRNGNVSWVSKSLMPNIEKTAFPSPASNTPLQNNQTYQVINGQKVSKDSNECFEYLKSKSCQAGFMCRYNHNGNDEHQKIKFCYRYLTGACRNGDNCTLGSHALLSHQIPVCSYYLRASCPYAKGCEFLHVKNSAKTPMCIHFNKGKCFAEFPCVFNHQYCQQILRERCNLDSNDESQEAAVTRFEDIRPLEWIE